MPGPRAVDLLSLTHTAVTSDTADAARRGECQF